MLGGKYLSSSPFSPIASTKNYRGRNFASPSTLVPGRPVRSPSPRKGPRPRSSLPNPPSFYFDVSDTYVATKLKMLICPFLCLDWMPTLDDMDKPASPRFNKVSADLYIPLMGLMTYVLLLTAYGTQTSEPGVSTSLSSLVFFLAMCTLETCLQWLALSWLWIHPPQLIELLAYSLYKVVPVLCIRLATDLMGADVYLTAFLYFGLMHCLFTCQAWRQFTRYGEVNALHMEENMRRTGFLYLISFLQLLFIHLVYSN